MHEELEKRDKVVSVFIAPNVSADAARMARWLKADEKIDIATIGINEFLDILSNYSSFDEIKQNYRIFTLFLTFMQFSDNINP